MSRRSHTKRNSETQLFGDCQRTKKNHLRIYFAHLRIYFAHLCIYLAHLCIYLAHLRIYLAHRRWTNFRQNYYKGNSTQYHGFTSLHIFHPSPHIFTHLYMYVANFTIVLSSARLFLNGRALLTSSYHTVQYYSREPRLVNHESKQNKF